MAKKRQQKPLTCIIVLYIYIYFRLNYYGFIYIYTSLIIYYLFTKLLVDY